VRFKEDGKKLGMSVRGSRIGGKLEAFAGKMQGLRRETLEICGLAPEMAGKSRGFAMLA
jgi:hypothetical protein